MRISDWSSDVCSSDLLTLRDVEIERKNQLSVGGVEFYSRINDGKEPGGTLAYQPGCRKAKIRDMDSAQPSRHSCHPGTTTKDNQRLPSDQNPRFIASDRSVLSQVNKSPWVFRRSAEHTSVLTSLMPISYTVI